MPLRDDLIFERPLGAPANVAELEYLLFLMTTTETAESVVTANDITLLLRSKHGLDLEEERVTMLFRDLGIRKKKQATTKTKRTAPPHISSSHSKPGGGGGDQHKNAAAAADDAASTSIDLCILTSMILAQHLLQISCYGDVEQLHQVFGVAYQKLLQDIGMTRGNAGENGELPQTTTTTNAGVTMTLIQTIVSHFGEEDNISVSDMQAMMDCVGPTLDVDSFRCALVSDLQQLVPDSDQHMSTHWQDVFPVRDEPSRIPVRPQQCNNNSNHMRSSIHQNMKTAVSNKAVSNNPLQTEPAKSSTNPFDNHTPRTSSNSSITNHNPFDDKYSSPYDEEAHRGDKDDEESIATRIPALSLIDRVAESYPSQLFAMTALICVVVSFFSYLFDYNIGDYIDCDNYASEALCMISVGIINWLLITIQLISLGVPFILLVSMGMSMHYSSNSLSWNLLQLTIGIASVAMFMRLSVIYPIHEALLDVKGSQQNNLDSLNKWSHSVSLTLGSLLLLFQALQLIRIVSSSPSKKPRLVARWFLVPPMTHGDVKSKQAATHKSQQFIDNALQLHEDDAPSAVALSNYFENESEATESVGTLTWFWNSWRRAIRLEGIWFHTRIVSSNVAQLFCILGLVAAMTAAVQYVNVAYDHDAGQAAATTTPPSPSRWVLYIPAEVDPRLVTYLDWRHAHPINEAAFEKNQLKRVQELLDVQPLQEPAPSSSSPGNENKDIQLWFMNSKALYYYNKSTAPIDSRSLVPYNQDRRADLLSVLNEVHNTTLYNASTYTPDAQILVLGGLSNLLCHEVPETDDGWHAPYSNTSFLADSSCAIKATTVLNDILSTLGANKLEQSVRWALSNSHEASVSSAFQSLAETVQQKDLIAGIIAGGVAGILAVILTAILYLPSYVICVLKLRSGYIPIDKTFARKYKMNTEEASVLFGSALWGCALSAGISAVVVGSIAFFTSWQETRTTLLAIFGGFVGWVVAVAIKSLFLFLVRGLYTRGLYRDRPGASNVVNLALECWHIALAAGYMVLQAIVLLAGTTIAMGHADTALPTAFTKDLMMTEAHRHPFIQRLSVFYLTKLRYGEKFCSRGGSCWRLIYILVLMPWLKKYRPGFENYDMGTAPVTEMEASKDLSSDLERLEHSNERLRVANERLLAENQLLSDRIRNADENNKTPNATNTAVQKDPENDSIPIMPQVMEEYEAPLAPPMPSSHRYSRAERSTGTESRTNFSMVAIAEQQQQSSSSQDADTTTDESATGWSSRDESSYNSSDDDDDDDNDGSRKSDWSDDSNNGGNNPPNPFRSSFKSAQEIIKNKNPFENDDDDDADDDDNDSYDSRSNDSCDSKAKDSYATENFRHNASSTH